MTIDRSRLHLLIPAHRDRPTLGVGRRAMPAAEVPADVLLDVFEP